MRIFFKSEKRKPRKEVVCDYCGAPLKFYYNRVLEIYKDEGVPHKNREYVLYKLCNECVDIVKKINDPFCEKEKENIFDDRFNRVF